MSTSRDDFGIAIRSALLQRGTRQKFSLFFLITLAAIIFFLDIKNFRVISISKNIINDAIYRLVNVANLPVNLFSTAGKTTNEIFFTFQENKKLKEELSELRAKNFQVEFLSNQNKNLRKTLESDRDNSNEKTLAKVLLDKDSPYLKSIIINRGSNSGIAKGMPVIDGNNLVGKIVEVNYLSSRVLLLNDLNSRIPVTLGEEGAQAILTGKGGENPSLEYLPDQFIGQNDITVFTSGKDGIFVPGITIGKTIIKDSKNFVKLFSQSSQLSFVTVQLLINSEEKF